MFFKEIHHVAIIVSDYEKSRRFYVEQLELPVIRENYRENRGDYKLDLQAGAVELEIFGVKNPPKRVTNPEACGLRHLAFKVEDIEAAVKWLKEKGIETLLQVCQELPQISFVFAGNGPYSNPNQTNRGCARYISPN